IAGQKLYEFVRQMKYKCEKIGANFLQADKWFPSSKLCSCCGQVKTNRHRRYVGFVASEFTPVEC
ncbi:transposase, partial [Paenibacillus alkaliterrae]